MNEIEQEQELQEKVRSALDADLEHLDPAIAGKLQQSRRRAVDLAEKKSTGMFTLPRLIPVGGFATLAVAAVAASLWFGMRPQPFPSRTAEEIEVLTAQGSLDMYKELDFFQMLAQTHETR